MVKVQIEVSEEVFKEKGVKISLAAIIANFLDRNAENIDFKIHID